MTEQTMTFTDCKTRLINLHCEKQKLKYLFIQ